MSTDALNRILHSAPAYQGLSAAHRSSPFQFSPIMHMTIPATIKAVKSQAGARVAVEEVALSASLAPYEVLVKNRAVGLNPTDWQAPFCAPIIPGLTVGYGMQEVRHRRYAYRFREGRGLRRCWCVSQAHWGRE